MKRCQWCHLAFIEDKVKQEVSKQGIFFFTSKISSRWNISQSSFRWPSAKLLFRKRQKQLMMIRGQYKTKQRLGWRRCRTNAIPFPFAFFSFQSQYPPVGYQKGCHDFHCKDRGLEQLCLCMNRDFFLSQRSCNNTH